ncbi:glutathione peroxidase [soil metagenome]
MDSVYDFSARTLSGAPVSLSDFRGRVSLVVNVASKCGYTPQYQGLERLHRTLAPLGFAVLAFPSNQFSQEPGTADQIGQFCADQYNVSFPLFEKVEVNGDNAHPLWQFLKRAKPGLLGTEAIKWNFTKFLVDRDGHVVRRYAPGTKPEEIESDITALL